MSGYSDEQLVCKALGESHWAFEELITQHQSRVLRTVVSIVSDEQTAQDIAQETFLSAWRNLSKLKERHKFGAWLNQIAVNFSRRWLRDSQKRGGPTIDASVTDWFQEQRYQQAKLRQEIWEAIDELVEGYRESVILHYISGYSYQEISQMLSVPVSTVRGRLHQARSQLRKEFVDMVRQLQLEIDSTVHTFLKAHAKANGVSVEGLVLRLIERYRMDADNTGLAVRKVEQSWQELWQAGRPSPDGRYFSRINRKTGNLAVRDLTTGECRDITHDGQMVPGQPHRHVGQCSVWSPDGKHLAYIWHCRQLEEVEQRYDLFVLATDSGAGDSTQLRIIGLAACRGEKQNLNVHRPFHESEQEASNPPNQWPCGVVIPDEILSDRLLDDGSEPRVLVGDISPCDWGELSPCDWSPDGKFLLAERVKPGNVSEIVLVSVADGSIRTLKSLDGQQLVTRAMSFSTDGRYVIYSRQVEAAEQRYDLFLLATDGSGEEIQVLGNDYDVVPAFPLMAPDGKSIVYSTHNVDGDPASGWSLWLTQVVDGQRVGEPQLVMRTLGWIYAAGFTQDGSLHYIISQGGNHTDGQGNRACGKSNIYLASLDMETGEVLSSPVLLRCLGTRNSAPAWSPDGKRLAYMSWRHAPDGARFRLALVIRSMDTGSEQEIFREELMALRREAHIQWSPDGRSILFAERAPWCWARSSLGVADVETGEVDTIKPKWDRHVDVWGAAWSCDGRKIYYTRERWGKGRRNIVAYDVATGEEQELCTGGCDWSGLFVSPDGKQIAFSEEERQVLKVVSTVSGEVRTLHDTRNSSGERRRSVKTVRWTSDSRYVLFQRDNNKTPRQPQPAIWRVLAQGGEAERLFEVPKSVEAARGVPNLAGAGASFHPDGQRIAYSKGEGGVWGHRELWVMENLLPTFAADK